MKKTNFKPFMMTLVIFTISISSVIAQQPTLKSSGYAPVNGLKLYYEIHGEGKPLIVLHGSYMTIGLNYGQMIPELAKKRQVIAIEMQGHGHTADINRDISFENLASDVAGLLKYLKIEKTDVLGYSLGASVALKFTLDHPEMVDRLVSISSTYKHDGWQKEAREVFLSMQPGFLENTPLKTEYDRIAPDKSQWTNWVKKMMVFDAQSYDFGKEHVRAIKCPVLMISGDNDGVDLNHVVEMYKAIGGGVFGDMAGIPPSRLAILPGHGHVSLMMETGQLLKFIDPFLTGTR